MLAIPTPATDPLNQGDWLELRSILVDDRSTSASDLRRELATLGLQRDDDLPGQEYGDGEEILVSDAFAEIENRARACPECYPFEVTGTQLRVRPDSDRYWAYIFCLLLSSLGADRADASRQVTELFEEVSELAASRYVSGKSVKFGFPRRVLPAGFIAALDEVCAQLGEGDKARNRPDSTDIKDARLDLIAWRPFPDQRKAQLILFGQCGAGGNWDEKLTDLQPRNFTDLYWTEPPAVDPVKGFFTPFRVGENEWYTKAKYGGVLFDRCRIAHLVCGLDAPPDVAEWIRQIIDSLKTARAEVAGGRLRQRTARPPGRRRRRLERRTI